MSGKLKFTLWAASVATVVCAASVAVNIARRAHRTYEVARDWREQIRYDVANHLTIGEASAAKTFDASYLDAVFGSEPDLVRQLKDLIAKGIAEDPAINLGEVTTMVVTYSKSADGKIDDVAVHVMGGFALGKRRPGFNHDGYFASQVDHQLWNTGNTIMGLLGRDMVVFADPAVSHKHDELVESVLSGDILPLVGTLTNKPLYFTAVFPDPKRMMPPQLRQHIQACIFKGRLSTADGGYEAIFLTKDAKAASYTLSMVNDLKLSMLLALRTRFDGVVHKTAWGDQTPTWWAFEMAKTMDAATLERSNTVIRLSADFNRPMVNATLKSIERMGRDMAVMRLIRDEKLDPRLADLQLASKKPLHYWSDPHQWGADWPVPSPLTNSAAAAPAVSAPAPAAAP